MSNKRTESLGDLIRHRLLIVVRCRRCQHQGEVRPGELLLRHGHNCAWEGLRYRCGRCGSRDAKPGLNLFDLRR